MRNVEKGEFSVRNGVRKLKSGMKVGYEVDVILKFDLAQQATPVKSSMYLLWTIVLARDFLLNLSYPSKQQAEFRPILLRLLLLVCKIHR